MHQSIPIPLAGKGSRIERHVAAVETITIDNNSNNKIIVVFFLSALSSCPFHCTVQDVFWPDLMNGRHVHTT